MWEIQKVIRVDRTIDEVPEGFLDILSPIGLANFKLFPGGSLQWLLGLSKDRALVSDDEIPLLLIGAAKLSFLDDRKEMWLCGTKYLEPKHIIGMRKPLWDWIREQSDRVLARVDSEQTARFVKLYGFVLTGKDGDGHDIYEAKICY